MFHGCNFGVNSLVLSCALKTCSCALKQRVLNLKYYLLCGRLSNLRDGESSTSAPMPLVLGCLGDTRALFFPCLLMIGGAIGPKSDDTEELSMKAPMSVSKPAERFLGVPNCASRSDGNRRHGKLYF